MTSRSIRRRLTLMVLASVTLVWAITLVSSFRHASREVRAWDDARLVEFAQLLAQLDQRSLGVLAQSRIDARVEMASKRHAPGSDVDSDELPRDILFQALDAGGRLIAASPALAAASALPSPPDRGDRPWTTTLAGQAWRVYTLHDASSGRTVHVMELSNTRSDLASGAARHISQPLLIALPLLAFLIWLSIGHSLAPLRTLSNAIRARDADSLEPVGIDGVPREARPLVDAINQLLSQLRQSITRERAFTSDAAHELKTPLAAIKVQAQVALATDDTAQQRLAMERVVQGVDRSARLAEQLLLLARLDERERIPASPVALDRLAVDAIGNHAAPAQQKHMRISLDSVPAPHVQADPMLIGILLDNLIDNAIKYGTVEGRVDVLIRRDGDTLRLVVRDNGPGVAEPERARLTDRFFRGTSVHASGSGLGLSIVARIAAYFDAQLSFKSGIDERGLSVEIVFPCPAEIATGGKPATAGTDSAHGA